MVSIVQVRVDGESCAMYVPTEIPATETERDTRVQNMKLAPRYGNAPTRNVALVLVVTAAVHTTYTMGIYSSDYCTGERAVSACVPRNLKKGHLVGSLAYSKLKTSKLVVWSGRTCEKHSRKAVPHFVNGPTYTAYQVRHKSQPPSLPSLTLSPTPHT